MPCRWLSAVGEEWGDEGLMDRGQGAVLITLSRQERGKSVRLDCVCSEDEENSVLGTALFWSLLVVTGHEDTRVTLSF